MSPEGTLWLDYPSRGGPSPQLSLEVAPQSVEYFYQHSLFVDGDSEAWPWVAASGVEGVVLGKNPETPPTPPPLPPPP